MSADIQPYLNPVPPTLSDMEIAVEALFGRSAAYELTREQKAAQEKALAPYIEQGDVVVVSLHLPQPHRPHIHRDTLRLLITLGWTLIICVGGTVALGWYLTYGGGLFS